jgi:hypothetical protein
MYSLSDSVKSLLCFFLVFKISLAGFNQIEDWKQIQELRNGELEKPHTFLFSYPRSGNSWMRFCLEFLTQRPTVAFHALAQDIKFYSFPLGFRLNFEMDLQKQCIWKVHDRQRMEKIFSVDPNKDILIMLIRNYKECIPRHLGDYKRAIIEFDDVKNCYLDNIVVYDEWSDSNKILVYYEDFISNPRKTLSELLLFLGESGDKLTSFLSCYDEYKNRSLKFYQQYIGATKSRGEDLLYHSKLIPFEDRLKMESFVKENYPYIWGKYLYRYDQ